MDKPRIFLGSSGKQEKLLQALTRGLEDIAHVEPWTASFNPGTTERLESHSDSPPLRKQRPIRIHLPQRAFQAHEQQHEHRNNDGKESDRQQKIPAALATLCPRKGSLEVVQQIIPTPTMTAATPMGISTGRRCAR